MPLPFRTLSTVQTAGAAIHAADAELKQSVQDLSARVKAAMLDNPFDIGNDSWFEDWKTMWRLSQAVAQVEMEFERIYDTAATIAAPTRASVGVGVKPKLAAPKRRKAVEAQEVLTAIEATDAVIKKVLKKRKATSAKKKAKRPLASNTAKVLARLQEILNTAEFLNINRSAVAAEIGMPKVSIGTSIVKLVQTGQLVEDASGAFKLAMHKAG